MKKFLVGVGDVRAMQGNNVVFVGKTMLDTGIEIGTSSTEIRGGYGNSLQSIYYHTSSFKATITDTQWSLPLIALNTGANIVNGGNIWGSESVTIQNGSGTLVGTPISVVGSTPNVCVDYNGTLYNFAVNGQTFSVGGSIPDGTAICASYVNTQNSAQSIVIPANLVPERVRLYITANLAGDTTGSGFIGTATVEVPVYQLSGAQTISMTADGYSNTPLSGMAIAYTDSAVGCADGAYYAKITEYLTNTNWYDSATALAIEGGDFSIAQNATQNLVVWYVANGRSYIAPNSDLTFTITGTGTATVGENTGIVTGGSAAGTNVLLVKITQKTTIEAQCTVTTA